MFVLSLVEARPFLGGAYPTDPHHRDLAEQVGDVLIGLGIIQWGFEGLPVEDNADKKLLRNFARKQLPRSANIAGYASWRIVEFLFFIGCCPTINCVSFFGLVV